jgi:hypothetical protein
MLVSAMSAQRRSIAPRPSLGLDVPGIANFGAHACGVRQKRPAPNKAAHGQKRQQLPGGSRERVAWPKGSNPADREQEYI